MLNFGACFMNKDEKFLTIVIAFVLIVGYVYIVEQDNQWWRCKMLRNRSLGMPNLQIRRTQSRKDLNIITRKNGIPYSVRSNRDRFFYPDEWIKFYGSLKKSQKLTFDVMINTGARINEARHIKVGDIDTTNQRLILRVTKVKAKKKEKNPRPRTIPLSSQFTRRLKAYIKDKNNDEYLRILSTPAANIALKNALQKALITDWYMFSIHNVRKTLETWLMALGVDSLKLTAHFGHDIRTAAHHYVSPDIFSASEKQKIRDIIGDLYQERW